jgi:acetyl esterase
LALPRLSPRIEHRALRVACGLPAGVQRAIFGAPPRIDGQELSPQMQALLRMAALAGDRSFTEAHSPVRARAENAAGAAAVAGPPRAMERVEPLEIPGPAGTMPARLYVPNGATPAPRPLLVYYHGGGWVIGDLDTHDGVCRFLAAEGGIAVLSVGYRLAPEHPFPAPLDDSLAAFRWAVEEAGELGADPARIAVGGDSAGGNLAAALCLQTRDAGGPSPALQALIYPVTDAVGDQRSRELFAEGFLLTKADMEWFEGHYLPPGTAVDDPRVSVLRAPDLAGLPPAFLLTAGFDPLRDEGEAYAARLREAGVRVALRRHPGLIHGFANMTAISGHARVAMHELVGALRLALC